MPTWGTILIIIAIILALIIEPIRNFIISAIISIGYGLYCLAISVWDAIAFIYRKLMKTYYQIRYKNVVNETNIARVRNDAKQMFDNYFPNVNLEDVVKIGGKYNPISIDIDTLSNRLDAWYITIRNDCERAKKQLNKGNFSVDDFLNILEFGFTAAAISQGEMESGNNLKSFKAVVTILQKNIPNIQAHKESISKGAGLFKRTVQKYRFRYQLSSHIKKGMVKMREAISAVDKKPYKSYTYYLNEVSCVLQNNWLDCFRDIDWSVYEDMLQVLPQLTEEQVKMITAGINR